MTRPFTSLRRGVTRREFAISDPITGATLGRNQSTAASVMIDADPKVGLITLTVLGTIGGSLIRLPLREHDAKQLISALREAVAAFKPPSD